MRTTTSPRTRRLGAVVLAVTAATTMAACGPQDSTDHGGRSDPTGASTGDTTGDATAGSTSGTAGGELTPIVVGASVTPHAEILEFVEENLAADAGFTLEIVEYTDYVQPNVQLAEGALDANFFQ